MVFIAVAAYAAWYSHERREKLAQVQQCDEQMAHPIKPQMVTGPDGNPAPLYSVNGCATVVVPPSLWDIVRGHIVFENVPTRMKVNPYSLGDILLGRYTFGPSDIGCDQSATTTDCSTIVTHVPATPHDAVESDPYAAAILACHSKNPSGAVDMPIANNSVQYVRDTTRLFINTPKDLYPKDILHSWTTVSGNATGGYISNGGLPGEAFEATPDCWSTYVELDGNGEVDLRVKSVIEGAPDYFVRFIVTPAV